MPFYAVAIGHKVGVFDNWTEAQPHTQKVAGGARFKKFLTEAEAWQFVSTHNKAAIIPEGMLKRKLESGDEEAEEKSEVISTDPDLKKSKKKAKLEETPNTTEEKEVENSTVEVDERDITHEDGYAIVFTDGACQNNGNQGACAGIGVFWGIDHSWNVGERIEGRMTNNRAEIMAATRAITRAKEEQITKLRIYSDSEHLINCMTKWLEGWKKKNWQTAKGEPVKNMEELQELDVASQGITVAYCHVRSHTGVFGNEAADKLAVAAVKSKKKESS